MRTTPGAAARSCRFLLVLAALIALVLPATGAAAPSLDLDVELDPASRRLAVGATVVPESDDFRFSLHESLDVGTATAGGKQVKPEVIGREGALRYWRVRMPPGAERLQLEYGGVLPALDRRLDHRGVLQGLPPMAAEEGSFLPASGGWYPLPAPLFTYRVSLSVPAGQRALVPGRLRSEVVPVDGAQRYRASFEFDHPVDGIDLMAGPWVVRELRVPRNEGPPLRLRTYFDETLDAIPGLADGYLQDTRRYIERYSGEIGPYPFTEFSVVASPLPTGFGMPTLTYLGAQVLRLPFIRGSSLGHEVLHNWWGNGVYADYRKGNWSEGLTTFMADYAYKEAESPAAAREMRLGWLRDFASLPEGGQQPLASFRSRTHGAAAAVGYGKAAMLFVMLRDLIGADAFRQGIQAFWADHRFRVASWDDLRNAFQRAAERDLTTFFDQWLERPGGPAVRLVDATAREEGAYTRLSLRFEQTAPAYALHLPVALEYPGREDLRWLDVDQGGESISLAVGDVPSGVRLDPDIRVWRRLEPAQLPPILRQWIVARHPRVVLLSGADDVQEAAAFLGARLFEQPFRPTAIEALGGEGEPVLLIGLHEDVDAVLARGGLPSRPESLAGRGSAQVWTIQRNAEERPGPPVAVISARDADALRALARPLPHYGGQSWLVFDGGRALDRGVWPARGRLVPVRVEP